MTEFLINGRNFQNKDTLSYCLVIITITTYWNYFVFSNFQGKSRESYAPSVYTPATEYSSWHFLQLPTTSASKGLNRILATCTTPATDENTFV